MEIKGLGNPRLHLGQLITDDFYQHGWKLHFQSLRLSEGVETEFQQIANKLKWKRKKKLGNRVGKNICIMKKGPWQNGASKTRSLRRGVKLVFKSHYTGLMVCGK